MHHKRLHENAPLQLGIDYKSQGKLLLAENHLKQAIVLLPAAGKAHTYLGDVYLLQRRFNDAEKAYRLAQQAVALAPTAKHYDTLAYTYYRNAQYPKALEAINEAITIAPNVDAYNKLRSKNQEAQAERKNK